MIISRHVTGPTLPPVGPVRLIWMVGSGKGFTATVLGVSYSLFVLFSAERDQRETRMRRRRRNPQSVHLRLAMPVGHRVTVDPLETHWFVSYQAQLILRPTRPRLARHLAVANTLEIHALGVRTLAEAWRKTLR